MNKVGTCPLATLARLAQRPFYVVAETDKILPARLEPFFRLPLRRVPGVRLENLTFDLTPHRLVSAILTDAGKLSRKELTRQMRMAKVSGVLLRVLRRERV